MEQREYNRFGLPSVEEQEERYAQQVENLLWQDDFLRRTKDEGIFAL